MEYTLERALIDKDYMDAYLENVSTEKIISDIKSYSNIDRATALKDFMCALIQVKYNPSGMPNINGEHIAHKADELTTAYINELNKPLWVLIILN